MSLSRYPKYKDSGVMWLGNVPEHWRSVNLRWISKIYSGGTPDKLNLDYWTDGTIPWLNSGSVNRSVITEPSTFITQEAFEKSAAKWVKAGALVMALAGQGKTKGMVAQLGIASTCNQSMAAIVPAEHFSARFLYWWLTSNYQSIRNLAGGDLRDGLNLEILGSIPTPLLQIAEQSSIATFLDEETSKIDALVEEQRRLIDLLQEKRQAVISHAVTRGLDPAAPMKPSGYPLFGIIPRTWRAGKLRRFASRVVVGIAEATTQAYADDGVPILRATNIRPGKIEGELLRIDPKFSGDRGSKQLRAGDLVTVRTGYPGVTAVIPEELGGCQCFTMLITSLRNSQSARYQCYFLNSTFARQYFDVEGWGSAQTNISVPILQDCPVPSPSFREQEEIADYLDEKCEITDSLIDEANHAIELFQERRAALISAAVTGQIDVRNYRPQEAPAVCQ
jgi:type I restriction enzyme S subunit